MSEKFTKREINSVLKEEGLLGVNCMTSAEYKKVINKLHQKKRGDYFKKATKQSSKEFRILRDTSYSYSVKFVDDDIAVITLLGQHFSKNRVNSMSMREKMVYKTRMKDAAKIFFMKNRDVAKKCMKWDRVKIFYEIYNPRSRDTNATDLKIFRDTFTINGIILDDNRKVIPILPKQKEIISPEYKIVATITRIKNGKEEEALMKIEESLEMCSALFSPEEAQTVIDAAAKSGVSIDEFIYKQILAKRD